MLNSKHNNAKYLKDLFCASYFCKPFAFIFTIPLWARFNFYLCYTDEKNKAGEVKSCTLSLLESEEARIKTQTFWSQSVCAFI